MEISLFKKEQLFRAAPVCKNLPFLQVTDSEYAKETYLGQGVLHSRLPPPGSSVRVFVLCWELRSLAEHQAGQEAGVPRPEAGQPSRPGSRAGSHEPSLGVLAFWCCQLSLHQLADERVSLPRNPSSSLGGTVGSSRLGRSGDAQTSACHSEHSARGGVTSAHAWVSPAVGPCVAQGWHTLDSLQSRAAGTAWCPVPPSPAE